MAVTDLITVIAIIILGFIIVTAAGSIRAWCKEHYGR